MMLSGCYQVLRHEGKKQHRQYGHDVDHSGASEQGVFSDADDDGITDVRIDIILRLEIGEFTANDPR